MLYLDVGTGEIVLRHDVVLQTHVLGKSHPVRVNREDASLRLLVRQRKFYLPVDPSRSNQSRVQRLDAICGHNHLRQVTTSTFINR